MWNFLNRLIANANASRAVETTQETDIIKRYEHDKFYVELALSSNDFGWSNVDESVKVKLLNPEICSENEYFTTWNIMEQLKGTGHKEWEAILASALMKSVCDWKKNGANLEELPDISSLYNRDLLAKQKFFSKERISNHLKCILKTEKVDADGTIYVRYKVA